MGKQSVDLRFAPCPCDDELAAEALLDQFKRAVRDELELLEVRAVSGA